MLLRTHPALALAALAALDLAVLPAVALARALYTTLQIYTMVNPQS